MLDKRYIAEAFGAGDHDLDVGIVAMAFRVAFGDGLGGIFVDDGEDILSVYRIFARFYAGKIRGEGVGDGFFEVGADALVPV